MRGGDLYVGVDREAFVAGEQMRIVPVLAFGLRIDDRAGRQPIGSRAIELDIGIGDVGIEPEQPHIRHGVSQTGLDPDYSPGYRIDPRRPTPLQRIL